jgi:nucleoside-diphosphate-sugar epimerase/lipopolysaccharide/colanic/teichoic acid biosynthesis glycosyltransferase
MRILVTGASGFIGSALVRRLAGREGLQVIAMGRSTPHGLPEDVVPLQTGDFLHLRSNPLPPWKPDVCIHLAARVDAPPRGRENNEGSFHLTNTVATVRLARWAAEAGVRRFIFISSAKVHGETSRPGRPFREDDPAAPEDAYARSKWDAERALEEISRETGMELVVIRPPLVYGPGVKGNFARLMGWMRRGIPLPLGAVRDNRRSLAALDNLVDLIETCVEHPAAAGHAFLVSDGEDLSTAELLRRLALAMGRRSPRLLPVPAPLLETTAQLLGRQDMVRRLLGSFQLDISKARRLLGWVPPVGVDEALRRTAQQKAAAAYTRRRPQRMDPRAEQPPNSRWIRVFDVLFSALGLAAAAPLMAVICALNNRDGHSPLFRQVRVGRHGQPFTLVKFRTMKPETPSVATHMADPAHVTPLGRRLRRTKLDELPQLFNVLKGDMSLVGPRPCLYSQRELIEAREKLGVHRARPGITGLAQVKGIDMSTPELLAETDRRLIETLTPADYLRYIVETLLGRGREDRIRSKD